MVIAVDAESFGADTGAAGMLEALEREGVPSLQLHNGQPITEALSGPAASRPYFRAA